MVRIKMFSMKQSPNRRKVCALLLLQFALLLCSQAALSDPTLNIIPYPQEVVMSGENFSFPKDLQIIIDKNASAEDRFAIDELIRILKKDFDIQSTTSSLPSKSSPTLTITRKGAEKRVGQDGYQLSINAGQYAIRANGAAGLFYGTQTFLQLIQKRDQEYTIPGLKITDWPSIKERAVHYDTKHHQDKKGYVESFIRDIAHYKINMLVWEWEDKLEYPSHPEISAPGAFTQQEMQHFTAYARQYHVQLVPLVQGLGHVSFILKWPQYKPLREIASSNWEFCPLKEGTYELLFDLWEDAIKATPGSAYIHIGSDETYELAACEACQAKAKEIGKSGVYLLFANKAAQHLKSLGRQVMVWEPPMGWEMNKSPATGIQPQKGLVLTESYDYENPDFTFAKKARSLGFKVYAYDPNPGIEHLFLPYFYKEDDDEAKVKGCLQDSYEFLKTISNAGAFDGMISTSWDDSGLHNQVWMLRFATAAAFSWNGNGPAANEFQDAFFKDYYGGASKNMSELYQLLNEGAYYYMSTFERKVWHHGDIGKTHLPDLPRGDALEFDPYWNKMNNGIIKRSHEAEEKMQRALLIIEDNLKANVKNSYDFEVFGTIVKLIWHTARTYNDLSELESFIAQANKHHFEDHALAYQDLKKAAASVQSCLNRRQTTFNDLVTTWEKVRLPKGLSTKENQYFFQQDRARHFANRQPDMNYLIYDEQKLDMEGYLKKLEDYMQYYQKTYLDNK